MAVQKQDYPVIFIGLGGTGKDAIIAIKKKFSERLICDPITGYPRRSAFMVLDADGANCGTGRAIQLSEYIDLTVPRLDTVFASYDTLQAYEKKWIYPNLTPEAIAVGAGGIRQIGRFQLFQHVHEFKTSFYRMLDQNARVSNNDANAAAKVDVVICGGLTGGTGSGTLLDTAYLVKNWLQNDFSQYTTHIYGFFTLPAVYEHDARFADITEDTDKLQLMKANAYAALKELDYWMNTRDMDTKMDFVQQYGHGIEARWNAQPFNLVFLMDDKRTSGTPILDPYESIIDKIAEMMLYCYADENSQNFTFDSFMSNVSTTLLGMALGAQHNIPVNYTFASVGAATTEAVEQTVNAYETKLVLEKVTAPVLVVYNGTQWVTQESADLNGVNDPVPTEFFNVPENERNELQAIFGDKLDFSRADTSVDAFQNMVEEEIAEFSGTNRYTATEWSKEQVRDATSGALFETQILQRFGNVKNEDSWSAHAKIDADKTMHSIIQSFDQESLKNIQDPRIGPCGWLDFIQKTLIPWIEQLNRIWEGKLSAGNADYQENRDAAKNLSVNIHDRGLIEMTAYMLHPINDLEAYKRHELGAAKGKRQAAFAAYQADAIAKVLKRVNEYKDVLSYLMRALSNICEDSNREIAQGNDGNQLVTLRDLENYFNSQQANRDMALANARASVWSRIAHDSLNTKWEGEDGGFVAQEEDRQKLMRMVQNFLLNVTQTLQMNNLDWMVKAVVPSDDATEQVNYVSGRICTALDNAAEAMLPEHRTNNIPVLAVEKRYLSVPENAQIWLQGFQNYATNNTTWVKRSKVTDRVLWLKVKVGYAAANITDMADLQKAYEERLGAAERLRAGMHLYETLSAIRLSESTWLPERTWALLPGLQQYELLRDNRMSRREAANWATAQEVFQAALQANLVLFNTPLRIVR